MFRVKVLDPDISAVLQKLAFKAGFGWGNANESAKDVMFTHKEVLYFDTSNRSIWYNYGYNDYNKFTDISINEAIERLKSFNPDIIIAGHVVKFTPQGISVGCATVDRETIIEICHRLNPPLEVKF